MKWKFDETDQTMQSISIEEMIDELRRKGSVSVAGGTVKIIAVLKRMIGEIGIYELVMSRSPFFQPDGSTTETGKETNELTFETVEDFDTYTLANQDFLRCEYCGRFPKRNYWYVRNNKQQNGMCLCTNQCLHRFFRKYASRMEEKGETEAEVILVVPDQKPIDDNLDFSIIRGNVQLQKKFFERQNQNVKVCSNLQLESMQDVF